MPVNQKAFEGIGERLRQARRSAGLSQGQLQIKSGVPKSRLSRYENEHLLPSLNTLHRLVDALGVSEGSILSPREAHVDEFCQVLRERGVRFASAEDARTLAGRVADMVELSAKG
ncbi:MAG: helix-turn-helix transcriptional regulator [Actinomycetota bacterium]